MRKKLSGNPPIKILRSKSLDKNTIEPSKKEIFRSNFGNFLAKGYGGD